LLTAGRARAEPGSPDYRRRGASQAQATARLERDGFNEVLAGRADGIVTIVYRQLSDTVILVLLAAAVLTALVGDVPDIIVMLAVVVLNAALGATQEVRSGRALAALADLTAPQGIVVRDGAVGVGAVFADSGLVASGPSSRVASLGCVRFTPTRWTVSSTRGSSASTGPPPRTIGQC
jgi:hypothetical protein